jgi:hypothetical protein
MKGTDMKAWIGRILPAIAVVIAGVLGYLGAKYEPRFVGPIPAADKFVSTPAPKVAAPAPVVIPVATVPVVVPLPATVAPPPPAPVVAAPPAEKPKPKKAKKKRDNGFFSGWKLSI